MSGNHFDDGRVMTPRAHISAFIVAVIMFVSAISTVSAAEEAPVKQSGENADNGATATSSTVGCADTTRPAPVADDTPIDPERRPRPGAPSRTDSSSK